MDSSSLSDHKQGYSVTKNKNERITTKYSTTDYESTAQTDVANLSDDHLHFNLPTTWRIAVVGITQSHFPIIDFYIPDHKSWGTLY